MYKRESNLVSIVITSHNIAPFIEDCLDSLAEQTYRNIEVLIVDDASEDDTLVKINKWQEINRPEFKVVVTQLPRNIGFSGAINTGFFMSKGEFIAVQDGDDISHPDRLEKQVNFLKQNPEYSMVGTNYVAFPHGSFFDQVSPKWLQYGENILTTYQKGGHCVCHGTILFRGEVFDQLGGPTRNIPGAEDYELIAKFIKAKLKIENLKDVLYYYRMHPSQRSRNYYKKGGS